MSSSPSAKSEEERISTPQEEDAVFVLDFVVLPEVLRCSENARKALGTAFFFKNFFSNKNTQNRSQENDFRTERQF